MKYEDVSPTMRAFIGTWEVLRKLGYSADDIFFQPSKSVKLGGALGAFCVLRTQGKEFSVDCGPIASVKEARKEYARVTAAMTKGQFSEEDLRRTYEECEAYRLRVDMLMAMHAKGFILPKDLPS